MPPKIVVEARGLCKTYDLQGSPVAVLKGVDLTISEGETAAIVGPSGAGKSTLLHLLGVLDRPTDGEYRLDGIDVLTLTEKNKASLRLRGVGFVFQFHHLLPEFTALENVMLPALMLGLSHSEAESAAMTLLNAVGLHQRAAHKPGELSGGEQQRVSLARALVNRPKLILADEPTGNLDAEAAMMMKQVLWETCSNRAAAVILVTHNLTLAAEAGVVYQMRNGVLSLSKPST